MTAYVPRLLNRIRAPLRALRRSESGVAYVEFALCLPIFTGLAMYGTEMANLASFNMRVSQAALTLSDNAARLGQTDTKATAIKIKESEVNNAFLGSSLQSKNIGLLENGRIILSSLERNILGGQQIKWQRCAGKLAVNSAYGPEGTGALSLGLLGLGAGSSRVVAQPGEAVMFVEIVVNYTPLFGTMFVKDRSVRQEAALNIRDNRDLSTGLQDDVGSAKKLTCDKYQTM